MLKKIIQNLEGNRVISRTAIIGLVGALKRQLVVTLFLTMATAGLIILIMDDLEQRDDTLSVGNAAYCQL